MEITLTFVTNEEGITISTQKSEYHFSILNSRTSFGVLRGGLMGHQGREAFFVGAVVSHDGEISISRTLRTGTRALFCLEGAEQLEWLTTSVITEIAVDRAVKAPQLCACVDDYAAQLQTKTDFERNYGHEITNYIQPCDCL